MEAASGVALLGGDAQALEEENRRKRLAGRGYHLMAEVTDECCW